MMVPGAWNKKSQRQSGNMRVWQCRLYGLMVPGIGFCVRRTANKKAPHNGEALNSLSTYEAMATISDLHEMYAI